MDYFDSIYGNDGAKELLRSSSEAGTLSHAYIIEGVPGSGRKSLARAALCTLAHDAEQARRISDGVCSDIYVIKRDEGRTLISVDSIREIRSRAWLSPAELDFRAFIIDGAQFMSESAQNSLLKILEEPPDSVYFFLICESGGALLPTVRSRAQTLRTELPTHELAEKALRASLPAALSAKGMPQGAFSIGQAIDILEGREKAQTDLAPAVTGLLDVLCGQRKADVITYSSQIPDDREGYIRFLTEFTRALRDMLFIKKGADDVEFFSDARECADYAAHFSAKNVSGKLRCVIGALENAEKFVNIKLSKTELLDKLWR